MKTIADYDQELILLYRDRIHSDPIFDDDSFIHGHNCKCCTICYDDPSKYEKKEKTAENQNCRYRQLRRAVKLDLVDTFQPNEYAMEFE